MQLQMRCSHCQRPYSLKKEVVEAALETVYSQDLQYFTAQCPHCGKNNRVSRKQLKRAAPNWAPAQKKEG